MQSEGSDGEPDLDDGAEDENEDEPQTKEDTELDLFTHLSNLQTNQADMPALIQTEATAVVAWGFFGQRKGKGKGGKSGGKNRSWSSGKKPQPSLQERKDALEKLKKETTCMECGEHGRWKGDPECQKKKPDPKRFGGMTVAGCSRSCGETCGGRSPMDRVPRPEATRREICEIRIK